MVFEFVESDWSDSFSAPLKDRKSVPRSGERHLIRSAGVPADVLTDNTSVIEQPNKLDHTGTIEKSIPTVLGVAGQVNLIALQNTVEVRVPVEWVAGKPAGSPADEKGQYFTSMKGGNPTLFQLRGRARDPSSVMG